MEEVNTKSIVKKYGFKFTKSLGQNFLIDDGVLTDIVESAHISKDDYIIEIGPGVGTLTKLLLSSAKTVCSIEIDNKLIPILDEELSEFTNFRLINADALKIDFNELVKEEDSVKVVANLPYYVTTPIITKMLLSGYNFKSLTIMIQKEVAQRMAGKPSTKEYGSLSLLVQYYCDVTVVRKVSRECFIPKPKVESMVIRLDRLHSPRVRVSDEKLFFSIIRNSFNMRRKTLWNSLKFLNINKEDYENIFLKAGIDPKRRGETLSIEEFAKLAEEVFTYTQN
ncbi:MAG: 16S rRNA (adenine(1518)-N(6)/adenine(1519)-N(6))-dimethyltransferase RsmA [Clostridium sp.]|nr:16S rRNA (adenine(1518)-N(6)/adenine(1519)-N(6))-dimethyltransferase RsmA [Clostridium sp.]